VDVITGLIKANIPSRISFAVFSQVDSRTILDSPGAEKLLGRGDMLFMPVGAMKPMRIQGAFISDQEIEVIAGYVKAQAKPQYSQEIIDIKPDIDKLASGDNERDEFFDQAAELVRTSRWTSTSFLQRKLKIGYNRAGRIMDQLEEAGIVGPYEGENKPRRVLS
jgi:S-DNA-T family DNA segregation ATPase FtsK/SpoIIIE